MLGLLSFVHMFFSDLFFLFKQKTAYDMRISDWSSDVCSSDLHRRPAGGAGSPRRHHLRSARTVPRKNDIWVHRQPVSHRSPASLLRQRAASLHPSGRGHSEAVTGPAGICIQGWRPTTQLQPTATLERMSVGEGRDGAGRGKHGGRSNKKKK